MELFRVDLRGQLLVQVGHSQWLSEETSYELGSSRGGERLRLRCAAADLGRGGELRCDLDLPEGGRTLSLGPREWEVLEAEWETRTLARPGAEERELGGLWLALTPAPAQKLAWITEGFVGGEAGLALIDELRRAPAPVQPWEREAVGEEIRRRFAERYPEFRFELEPPLVLRYEAEDGREGSLDCESLWREVSDDPRAFEGLLRHRLSGLAEALRPTPTRAESLFPLVKPVEFLDYLREQGFEPVGEPLVDDLWIAYVLDQPRGMTYLSRDHHLPQLELAEGELRARAVANLWAAQDHVRVHGIPGAGHLLLTCGGNYEASLLLVDELWERLAPHLRGDPVVSVPTRDVVAIVGSEDLDQLAQLALAAESIYEQGSYPVWPNLLTRREGRWVELEA